MFVHSNIVLSDSKAKSLKLFSTTGKLLDSVKFHDGFPDIITSLPDDRIAVLISNSDQIAIFSVVDDKFNRLSTIELQARVRSIAGTTRNSIYMMKLKGQMWNQLVEIDDKGNTLRVYSEYLTGDFRFLSVTGNDDLVAVNEPLRQIVILSSDWTRKLNTPRFIQEAYMLRGITTDNNRVYIAADNGIQYFDVDFNSKHFGLQEFIGRASDVKYLRTLAVDETKQFLATVQIQNSGNEFVRIYKIKLNKCNSNYILVYV